MIEKIPNWLVVIIAVALFLVVANEVFDVAPGDIFGPIGTGLGYLASGVWTLIQNALGGFAGAESPGVG